MTDKGLYKHFQELNGDFDFKIIEMSVKQHQITIMFDDQELLFFNDINHFLLKLKDSVQKETYITTSSDVLYLTIPFNDEEEFTGEPYLDEFIKIIKKMAEKICQCPSLEYVISNKYIKCFLDKPGLYVTDLVEYEKIINEGKGTLELHAQRPYLLFVNSEF